MSHESSEQFLVFAVAGSEIGVPMSRVRSVSRVLPLTPVPYLPSEYIGIVNFRGDLCLTIDLATRLGLKGKSAGTGEPALVVIDSPPSGRTGRPPRCLLVDSVLRVAGRSEFMPAGVLEILDLDTLLSTEAAAS